VTESQHLPILVAIESDPTRYHGENAGRPGLLSRRGAEQLLAHLASDLAALLPDIARCSLTMAGALFDQTQLMRPGFGIYRALESFAPLPAQEGDYRPRLLSLGALEGAMPVPELQPEPDIPLASLQLLPLLVSGPGARVSDLSEHMEHLFLERGQLSAHTAQALESGFGIGTLHARFMTLTDLNAMLHLQLDHFGFLPLWELLDAALEHRDDAFSVSGRSGQRFDYSDGQVQGHFETFDYWAREGSGKETPGDAQALAQGYAEWTREYRQYLVTLAAHRVPVTQCRAGRPDELLEGPFLVEECELAVRPGTAPVTEHLAGDLGVVAITVAAEGGRLNFYPLRPDGLNELHAHLREAGYAARGVAFPGSISCDPELRRLQPDPAG